MKMDCGVVTGNSSPEYLNLDNTTYAAIDSDLQSVQKRVPMILSLLVTLLHRFDLDPLREAIE